MQGIESLIIKLNSVLGGLQDLVNPQQQHMGGMGGATPAWNPTPASFGSVGAAGSATPYDGSAWS